MSKKLKPIDLNCNIIVNHKHVTYTSLTLDVCGLEFICDCSKLEYEDVTDEVLIELLSQRISGIQKYRDINILDLYQTNSNQSWVLERIGSIDIPKSIKNDFIDGEMITDSDRICEILVIAINDYHKHREIRECEQQHDTKCKRCHRCTCVRSIDEFPEDDNYCHTCHCEIDNMQEQNDGCDTNDDEHY